MESLSSLVHLENEAANSVPEANAGEFDFMFIGQLAEKFGLTPKTIRFYEKAGLLEPARHGKFRTYVKEDANRLSFILKMRGLGVSIANIKSLANEAENGSKLAKSILYGHVEELKQKMMLIEQQLKKSAVVLEVLEKTEI
jgi:DNA-binding transcriptional MerR regulator